MGYAGDGSEDKDSNRALRVDDPEAEFFFSCHSAAVLAEAREAQTTYRRHRASWAGAEGLPNGREGLPRGERGP